ncbi:hypothetical protein EIP91_010725 [Steccherinum ochraceum]|uniref:Phytanoyl-CoA dioxygenase n=1 Tax=Steccherinum ochraceum TaxID=92696 RepID=A0A4R0RSH0_9APHY|nr:hypothetical protein EIP91_010725 [Steccherinum ochraceum]
MTTTMQVYKTLYDTQGYVILPRSLVIPSQTTFQDVLAAVTRIVAKARSGEWPHRRAVGRQFPPHRIGGSGDAWGVQHLMHPDLGEDAKVLKRWYTSPERAHSTTPDAPKNPLDMPGSIVVNLKPGETVFYNSNILHLGIYTTTALRATLHACMGSTQGGGSRARNVLQHGLEWMEEERFKEGLDDRGRKMLENTLRMKQGAGEVGYSLMN